MQLNVLFDFLGKSFLPQGEEAANNADGIDRPAGFGAALAAALGIVSRDESTGGSQARVPVADGEASPGNPTASVEEGDETAASAPRETSKPQRTAVATPVDPVPSTASATKDPGSTADNRASVPEKTPNRMERAPGAAEKPTDDGERAPGAAEKPTNNMELPSEPSPDATAAPTPDDVLATPPSPIAHTARNENPAPEASREGPSGPTTATSAGEASMSDASSSDASMSDRRRSAASPSTGPTSMPRSDAGVASGKIEPSSADLPLSPARRGVVDTEDLAPASRGETAAVTPERDATERLESPPLQSAASALPASDTSEESPTPRGTAPTDGAGHPSAAGARLSSPHSETVGQAVPTGRTADVIPQADPVRTGKAVDARYAGVRASELARAATHPSEASLPRETFQEPANTPSSFSGTKSGEAPSSSLNHPPAASALPPGAEHITLLEDGSVPNSGTSAAERRASAMALPISSTGAPDATSNAVPTEADPRTASEAGSETDTEAIMHEASGDADGGEDAESAVSRSDENVRRTETDRRDVARKEPSDRRDLASHGDRQFSQGDADTYSNSRHQQLSGRGESTVAANAVSSDFEPMVDDLLLHDVQVDRDPASDESAFTPEQRTTVAGITSTDGLQSSARTRTPGSIAWLRSMLAQSTKTLELAQGWKAIEVQLEEGLGTMTVKARRSEDGVSVSVTFSDPHLRTLAEANAHRLQDVLRSEYEANVDLSLMSDGSTDTPGDRNRPGAGRTARQGGSPSNASTPDVPGGSAASRPAAPGIRNEWIG